jgi:four helix bundle protein
MKKTEKESKYNLEDRTLQFARKVRVFVSKLAKTISNIEDGKQLIRSSGSVGANYIEANESFSKKDFLLRVKISRKEAKESRYWLQLISTGNNPVLENDRVSLEQEAFELMCILASIVRKTE